MRRTVHPVGTFAMCWNLAGGILSAILALLLLIELLNRVHSPYLQTIEYVIYLFLMMDMYVYQNDLKTMETWPFIRVDGFRRYVKMHWAYYTTSNHLICHPAKTAEHYLLEGPLVVSFLCGLAPYSLMILIVKAVSFNFGFTGEGVVWASKLRWIGMMHVIRVPIIIQQGRASFTNRNTIL